MNQNLIKRPRRNRRTAALRTLFQEHTLLIKHFIMPLFVTKQPKPHDPLLPGLAHYTPESILKKAEALHTKGIQAILLFPANAPRDMFGKEALNHNGIIPETIRLLKKELPSLALFCDVALDPYTTHGHDGVIDESGYVLNDATVDVLVKMSLVLAESGVDVIAPSDMMDGRVCAIRQTLDARGFQDVGILSYAAKYASSLYGPFRTAIGTRLAFGDKKSYQMDPANRIEALKEALLDEEEGADALLVKPAGFYLDIISDLQKTIKLPIVAYQVSGEYAMIMAAAKYGYLSKQDAIIESLLSIKRAGASCIISYAAEEII